MPPQKSVEEEILSNSQLTDEDLLLQNEIIAGSQSGGASRDFNVLGPNLQPPQPPDLTGDDLVNIGLSVLPGVLGGAGAGVSLAGKAPTLINLLRAGLTSGAINLGAGEVLEQTRPEAAPESPLSEAALNAVLDVAFPGMAVGARGINQAVKKRIGELTTALPEGVTEAAARLRGKGIETAIAPGVQETGIAKSIASFFAPGATTKALKEAEKTFERTSKKVLGVSIKDLLTGVEKRGKKVKLGLIKSQDKLKAAEDDAFEALRQSIPEREIEIKIPLEKPPAGFRRPGEPEPPTFRTETVKIKPVRVSNSSEAALRAQDFLSTKIGPQTDSPTLGSAFSEARRITNEILELQRQGGVGDFERIKDLRTEINELIDFNQTAFTKKDKAVLGNLAQALRQDLRQSLPEEGQSLFDAAMAISSKRRELFKDPQIIRKALRDDAEGTAVINSALQSFERTQTFLQAAGNRAPIIKKKLKEQFLGNALETATRSVEGERLLNADSVLKSLTIGKNDGIFKLLYTPKQRETITDFFTVVSPLAGRIGTSGQVVLQGRSFIIGLGKAAAALGAGLSGLIGPVGGLALSAGAAFSGNQFVKRVLLDPKAGPLAVKAAKGEPLTRTQLATLFTALNGTRVTLKAFDKEGKVREQKTKIVSATPDKGIRFMTPKHPRLAVKAAQ